MDLFRVMRCSNAYLFMGIGQLSGTQYILAE